MRYRRIGETEIEASVVALGTWVMGGWMWGGCDDAESERAILASLDAGVTMIDTAPIYGFGRSERVVGRAIKARRRDSIVIASKCGLYWSDRPNPPNCGEWHCYADDAGRTETLEKYAVYRWLRADVVRRGVEDSLRRLDTDYIDVMQVHHVSDRTTSVAETLGVLEDMKREGKIRAIGISNASITQLREYGALGGVDVDQERFSMLDRRVEKNGILDECRAKKTAFFAYSPMENGLLTGKITRDRVFKRGDLRLKSDKFTKGILERTLAALDALSNVAKRKDLTLGQLAIAWVLSRYEDAFALCGARTVEHALSNAAAGDAELDDDDAREIDEILKDFELIE